jgi:acyl dehydratase
MRRTNGTYSAGVDTQPSPPYRVTARNHATDSANRIHSDEVARQYGFRGGLVPGVTVFAYMTRPVAERWGRPWVAGGTLSARFTTPVYDGEEIVVEAVPVADAPDVLDVTVRTPDGTVAASGRATLAGVATAQPAHYPTAPLPTPDERPAASFEALPAGATLGSLPPATFHADKAAIFLAQIDDDLPVYKDGAVAHPGWLVRAANDILASNVRVGPWIHVSSQVTYMAAVGDGDVLTTRGRVMDTFDRKGHKFVDLDVLVVANDTTPVMHARHQAIFEPRRAGA